MEHEGVRALIDRLFKKPTHQTVQAAKPSAHDEDDLIITFESSKNASQQQLLNPTSQSSSRFIEFKQSLKQRMKAKRLQARQEEAEEKKIDEEYHDLHESDDENNTNQSSRRVDVKSKGKSGNLVECEHLLVRIKRRGRRN